MTKRVKDIQETEYPHARVNFWYAVGVSTNTHRYTQIHTDAHRLNHKFCNQHETNKFGIIIYIYL